jgi:hypothetical protein
VDGVREYESPAQHSLVEFLDWYDDQQEAETGILRGLRREYVEHFLKPASSEAGWGG